MSRNINKSEATKTEPSVHDGGERIAELSKNVKTCYVLTYTLTIAMGFFNFGKTSFLLTITQASVLLPGVTSSPVSKP